MSTSVNIDVTARSNASKDFDRIGDSAEKAGGKMSKLSKVLGGAAMGGALGVTVAAIGVAGEGLFEATKAALADDSAQKKLAKTLRNAAGARSQDVKTVETWISKQGRALGITDDELRPALDRLTVATGDVGKAQKLAALGMDVSAGTGKSLKQVTEALAKAENGQVAGLSRLGIATKDASGETKSFEQIQSDLQKKFGGQASTAANTLEGKMGRLKLVMDETKEAIGFKLMPAVSLMATWFLTKGIPAFSKWVTLVKAIYGPVFSVLGTAIGGLVERFRGAEGGVSKFRERLGTIVGAVMGVARSVGSNLQPVFVAIGGVIRDKVVPLVAQMRAKFDEWQPTIQKVLVVGGKVTGWLLRTGSAILGKVLPPLVKFAGFLVVGLVKSLVAVIDKGIKVVAWLIDLPKKISAAWDRVKKFGAFLRDSFTNILSKVAGMGATLGDKVWSGIKQIGKTLSGVGGWIWGKWRQGNQALYGRVRDMAVSAGGRVWSGVTSIGKTLTGFGGWAWGKFKTGASGLKDKFKGLGSDLTRGVVDGLRDVWDKVRDKTKTPLRGIIDKAINPFIGAVNKVVPGTKHDLPTIKGYAQGGRVFGAAPTTSESGPAERWSDRLGIDALALLRPGRTHAGATRGTLARHRRGAPASAIARAVLGHRSPVLAPLVIALHAPSGQVPSAGRLRAPGRGPGRITVSMPAASAARSRAATRSTSPAMQGRSILSGAWGSGGNSAATSPVIRMLGTRIAEGVAGEEKARETTAVPFVTGRRRASSSDDALANELRKARDAVANMKMYIHLEGRTVEYNLADLPRQNGRPHIRLAS